MCPFAAFLLAMFTLIPTAGAASPGPPKLDIAGACRDMAAQHDAATRADVINLASHPKIRRAKSSKQNGLDTTQASGPRAWEPPPLALV